MGIQVYIKDGHLITLDELIDIVPSSRAAKEVKNLRDEKQKILNALNEYSQEIKGRAKTDKTERLLYRGVEVGIEYATALLSSCP
jgi:hypothetical protein